LSFAGLRVRQLVVGAGHGCAVLDNQQVRCWGNEHQDQTGRSYTPSSPADPYPPVNFGPGRAATAVAVSVVSPFIDEAHSCAVFDDGSATCWGASWHGQLGQPGCMTTAGSACRGGTLGGPLPKIDLGAGARVKAIAAGGQHTCALLDDGRVKCWGANGAGQLGLGDTADRGQKLGDMGDQLPAVSL
jgi:E3 ubiquitin-protein ligase HERC3